MKIRYPLLAIILLLMLCRASHAGYKGLNFNYYYNGYQNLIEGATQQSILSDGYFNRQYLDISYQKNVSDGVDLNVQAGTRYTDYRFHDIADLELYRCSVYLNSRYLNFSAGNLFGYTSPLILYRPYKGVMLEGKLWNTSFVPLFGLLKEKEAGINNDRWIYGINLRQRINEKSSVAFSYAKITENSDNYKNLTGLANNVMSAGFTVSPLSLITWTGEFAQSEYTQNGADEKKEGNAARSGLNFNYKALNMLAEYEMAASSFVTLGGWAYADREKMFYSVSQGMGRAVNVRFYYDTYRDNINGEKSYTLRSGEPGVDINFFFKVTRLTFGARMITRQNDDESVFGIKTQSNIGSLGYSVVSKKVNIDFNGQVWQDLDKRDSGMDKNSLYFSNRVGYNIILDRKEVNILTPYAGAVYNMNRYVTTENEDIYQNFQSGIKYACTGRLDIDLNGSLGRYLYDYALETERANYGLILRYNFSVFNFTLNSVYSQFKDLRNCGLDYQETVISALFSASY